MANFSKRFTFTPNTTADPSEVNANFDELVAFVNESVAHLDGPAFTGIPMVTGEAATDPTNGNHLARKSYVDAKAAAAQAAAIAAIPTIRGDVTGSKTSDSAGNITIAHGFAGGAPPTTAQVTLKDGTGPLGSAKLANATVLSIDNTNINVRVYNSNTGSAIAGSGWVLYWSAARP